MQKGYVLLCVACVLWAVICRAQSICPQTVEWNWTDTPPTEFRVDRQDGPLADFVTIGSVSGAVLSYVDYDALPGQSYCYRIRALTSDGYSPYSNILCSAGEPQDTIAPTVRIVSPLAESVPRRANITIAVEARDAIGVAYVRMYVNGKILCYIERIPYQCAWRTPVQKGKLITLSASATDLAGNKGQAESVTVVTE